MLIKIFVLVLSLLVAACSSTSGTSGGTNAAVREYKEISEDLEPFQPISGKQGVRASDRVFFALDSSVIVNGEQATLNRQAKWLKKNPSVNITIEGHCDERGTREYNLALGDRRATAVKKYLVASGVSEDRISIISYGKERPAVLGSDSRAWSQNRRAVTILNN